MNARTNSRRFAGGAVALCLAAGAVSTQSTPQRGTAGDIEIFLRTAPIAAVEKDIEAGRTMPWLVTLDDGTTKARALFKYIDRSNLLPTRHSYRYELAAYALNGRLGLRIIPPVVQRRIEDTIGSLQLYVESCLSERDRERLGKEPPDPAAFNNRLADIQVFEVLAGVVCGDKDDTLIHQDTWEICRVDFAGAFLPGTALPEGCVLRRCSRRLLERLETLSFDGLKEDLQLFLDLEEIAALDRRRELIVGTFRGLIREKGEEAVLFEK